MFTARLLGLLVLAMGLLLTGCDNGGGGSATGGSAASNGDADVLQLRTGRLVDVYGLQKTAHGSVVQLFERDVLIGSNIQDERDANSNKKDSEITYDFFGFNPENLQPNLLITRDLGSSAFRAAFERLFEKVYVVTPSHYGQNAAQQPLPVVARNSAIEIVFSKDLGLADDFFVERDAQGRIRGLKNANAVQLLEILGDPTDNNQSGDFRIIPCRITYKGRSIVLDPVLLGQEGNYFNVPNNATGLPPSQSTEIPNIRIALALEGVLRIPGLRKSANQNFVGTNLGGVASIIRDFRSGNAADTSERLVRGYVRDTLAPRLLGDLAMRLERVDVKNNRLLLYKMQLVHELDRGDVLSLYPRGSAGAAKQVAEVIVDEDSNKNDQHVSVLVRDASGWAAYDPSKKPGYPLDEKKREAWLVDNGPTVVVATEFNAEKDDILNFARFSPQPLPDSSGKLVLNRNVSPFASLILRFTKPIDLSTVKPLDTLVLATEGDSEKVFDPKEGTPHLIYSQIYDDNGSQTALRIVPPLGFYLDDEMRKTNQPYYLHILGGLKGIRDLGNNPINFQYDVANRKDSAPPYQFFLDTTVNPKTKEPRFPNNRVVNIARRFLAADEDEGEQGAQDWFGAGSLADGKLIGRPTSRVTCYVDDINQLPSPPTPPLAYCTSNERMTLTGSTPLGVGIQNPLNPFGGRLQTVWREIDLSLSRVNPFDFNLDVEQMYWGPFQASPAAPPTTFDIYDRISLYLGHCEYRPNNCVGIGSALPNYVRSGLDNEFFHNYARNLKPTATNFKDKSGIELRPNPHPAYENQQLIIQNTDSVFEPSNTRRFLPLPKFKEPYFVWRDERSYLTGGGNGKKDDLISPFRPYWNTKASRAVNFQEDGRVGTIALPLLADFWTYPDSPSLPKNRPFRATGFNGWQISLTVTSSPKPDFRVYSGGYQRGSSIFTMDPTKPGWQNGVGGWNPNALSRTPSRDNTSYWIRADFLKRMSVVTFGFLDLKNPHNNGSVGNRKIDDPRLGPYAIGANERAKFAVHFEPPLASLPPHTSLITEFRGAAGMGGSFKLYDPLITGNAHVRFYSSGSWSRFQHTNKLSKYTRNPDELYDPQFQKDNDLAQTGVEYMNWRFLLENNVKVTPSTVPTLDSFAITYRIVEK
ncbi:MAG: hypothetical protein CSA62_03535 [Planctomycetota bacterium]|nr:MAG: hypothetical protein CSA62_03535 [Planctomycetota bacterium]